MSYMNNEKCIPLNLSVFSLKSMDLMSMEYVASSYWNNI